MALTSVSILDTATSNSGTIGVPSSVQDGDLMVLMDRATTKSGAPSATVPSGFEIVSNFTDNVSNWFRLIISYKIATGSDASSTLTGMNGANANRKLLLVFRGNAPITSVTPASLSEQGTDGNPSQQVVTSGSGTPPLIVIAGYGTQLFSTVDPRTFTPAKDGELVVPGAFMSEAYIAYKIYNSSPANVTVDMDDEGNYNQLASFYLALQGAGAAIAPKMMHYRRLRI